MEQNRDGSSAMMPDEFDRLLGSLDGLPDVTRTKASTLAVVPPLGVGGSRTFIVQTFRQRDQGDTVFLQCVGAAGSLRLVIPPNVTETIGRQREALTSKARSRGAQQAVVTRAARGITPQFHKGKGKRKR